MEKYEISLWEDFQVSINIDNEIKTYFDERKLCVIGADDMTSEARAINPKFVENINGTHTFSFKMYYEYVDSITGEKYANPFLNLLINERKLKVFWRNEWYDFIIKNIQTNTNDKSISYNCVDLYINELSKTGYDLAFDTDLQNNIGTPEELANIALEGTTWSYDSSQSDVIIQENECPVYETMTLSNFLAVKESYDNPEIKNIPVNKKILVFYPSVEKYIQEAPTNSNEIVNKTGQEIQFLYADEYLVAENDYLVTNGNCFLLSDVNVQITNHAVVVSKNSIQLFTINFSGGVSSTYRAERLVKSPKTVYSKLLKRYVTLCKDEQNNDICMVEETEYSDPMSVVNLIANPSNFKNTSGWLNSTSNDIVPEFDNYPKFQSDTNPATYQTKSYMSLGSNSTYYNSGIVSNSQYLKPNDTDIKKGNIGGFQKGDKFQFRIKAKNDNYESYIHDGVNFNVYERNAINPTEPTGSAYFTVTSNFYDAQESWYNIQLTCNSAISANSLDNFGFFLSTTNSNIKVEEAQFFKYAEGTTNYGETASIAQIFPGEINLQSIVFVKYKYFYRSQEQILNDGKDLTYIGVYDEPSDLYSIQYNNYEKIGTISIKESNRFNILQSIAETFKCWVRFRIDHEQNGKIKIINGIPQKFIYFLQEIGEDVGISFEYGIDLKTIQRSDNTTNLATKVIVKENSNEFATNGFCTIARSVQNYSRENYILNLDYYVQQGLIPKRVLEKDLYGTSSGDIGYYYYLKKWNTQYDSYSQELVQKRLELLKQNSQKIVYEQYLTSAQEQVNNAQNDIKALSSADWINYTSENYTTTRMKSLLNTIGENNTKIKDYTSYLTAISSSIATLESRLEELDEVLTTLSASIKEKHDEFNQKYGNYIFEGTWQDQSQVDDDEYYLDALNVAYTSSRPQVSYTIDVLRLSGLEEFSSKVFNIGNICYIEDIEYFGYKADGITPYKEKVLVSEATYDFDNPVNDILKIQNYKTRFDDLFQRIAATTQSLQYAQGEYARAAEAIKPDKTLSFSLLQDTFDYNENLVINASNQDVVWDETGITVTNKNNSADKTKIIAGGIFVSNDGGITWKNAIRGDGMSADLITAGRMNVGEVVLYSGKNPAFCWDENGLSAYEVTNNGTNFNKFVRHDQFGLYGYDCPASSTKKDFVPTTESEIWGDDNVNFGLTWKGFFMRTNYNSGEQSNVEVNISSEGKKVIYTDWSDPSNITTKLIDAVISVWDKSTQSTDEGTPKFYISKDGEAYFNGQIEAAGRIYCTSASAVSSAGYYQDFNIYQRNNNSYIQMENDGLILYTKKDQSNYQKKIQLGYDVGYFTEPYLRLGAGGGDTDGYGIIKKGQYGLYVGEGPIVMPSNGFPYGDENQEYGSIYLQTSSSFDNAWVKNPEVNFTVNSNEINMTISTNTCVWGKMATIEMLEDLCEATASLYNIAYSEGYSVGYRDGRASVT